jgi:hypothetical protein
MIIWPEGNSEKSRCTYIPQSRYGMIPVGGRNFVHGRSATRVRGGLATSWPQFIDPAGIAAIVRERAQLGDAKNTFLTHLHMD